MSKYYSLSVGLVTGLMLIYTTVTFILEDENSNKIAYLPLAQQVVH